MRKGFRILFSTCNNSPTVCVIKCMKTKKWLVIGVAAAVTVGGLTLVRARADDANPAHFGRGRFLSRVKKALDLSDDQVSKIKSELGADKTKLTGLLTAWHDAQISLRETIQKPGATEAEIRAASAKVAAVEADLAVERNSLYGRISPILTAGQLEKVDEFQQRVDDYVDGAIVGFGKRLME
jgi:periplasmic protein CpxP/Spy